MALHRLTALALAGVLTLGVSACSDDTPPQTAPSTTASASPSPSSTGPVAPVLPELAKRKDDVGAKAFVKYWFETFTYAMRSGDAAAVRGLSAEECKTCSGLVDQVERIYGSGGHVEGGSWQPVAFADDPSAPAPLRRWLVQVKQARHTIVGAETGNGPVAKRHFPLRISVVWRDGGWLLQEAAEGRL